MVICAASLLKDVTLTIEDEKANIYIKQQQMTDELFDKNTPYFQHFHI